MREDVPRYVRFARSLALVGGLGLLSCGDDETRGGDVAGDTTTADAADASGDGDTSIDCSTCDCAAAEPEACYDTCCFVPGPLYPPDLPRAA